MDVVSTVLAVLVVVLILGAWLVSDNPNEIGRAGRWTLVAAAFVMTASLFALAAVAEPREPSERSNYVIGAIGLLIIAVGNGTLARSRASANTHPQTVQRCQDVAIGALLTAPVLIMSAIWDTGAPSEIFAAGIPLCVLLLRSPAHTAPQPT